jgi:hypothetical protein
MVFLLEGDYLPSQVSNLLQRKIPQAETISKDRPFSFSLMNMTEIPGPSLVL